MKVYLRKYELVVGSPEKTYEVTAYLDTSQITNSLSSGHSYIATDIQSKIEYTDYRTIPAGDKALAISDLHIEADVAYSSQTKDIKSNNTKIRIFNLSSSSRNFIQKNGLVFLKAGYEEGGAFVGINDEDDAQPQRSKNAALPLIFCGQIEHVVTEKKGQDMITELYCKDLGYVSRNVKISKSYPRGFTTLDIIRDLLNIAALNGIPTGYLIEPTVGTAESISTVGRLYSPLNIGFVAEGNLLDVLSELCVNVGLQAYTSAGQLYVEPMELKQRIEVVILSLDSIKSIQKEEDTAGHSMASAQLQTGIKVTTFLNGGIAANKMLKIEAGNHAGIYKIKDVQHKLSYEGQNWDTEVSATKV